VNVNKEGGYGIEWGYGLGLSAGCADRLPAHLTRGWTQKNYCLHKRQPKG